MNKKELAHKLSIPYMWRILAVITISLGILMGISAIIIILLFSAGSHPTPKLHLWIYSYAKKSCIGEDSCILQLKDVTPFEWDTFYVMSRKSNKEKILKLKYPGHKTANAYVFLKNGKIAHYEDYIEESPDVSEQRGPYFRINGKSGDMFRYDYMLFSPEEAVFHVRTTITDSEENKFYYTLYPVKARCKVFYEDVYPYIESYFEKSCEDKDHCVLSLKDIMFFEWDELYIMSFFADRSEILGFKYYVPDDYNSTSYVFLQEKRVIFSDNHYDYLDLPDSYDGLIFSTDSNPEHHSDYIYMIFTPKEAVFHVKQIKASQKSYILMYPIEPPSVVVRK